MLEQLKRLLKHSWAPPSSHFFTEAALQQIAQLVADSEKQHNAEIRVCIEHRLPNSYLMRSAPMRAITRQRALAQFGKLRVWDTEHNNGVLIYLLLAEHAIEIVADRGLNDKRSAQEWQHTVAKMRESLKADRYEQGLAQAVAEVSSLLTAHFPLAQGQGNLNELPDQPAVN